MTAPPRNQDCFFIVEACTGKIRILENGTVLGTPFIDLGPMLTDASGEKCLLGLAFHANDAAKGFLHGHCIDNALESAVARCHVRRLI